MLPRFLDVHSMKAFDEQSLKKAHTELPDEYGVSTENALYNVEADRLFCVLDAPDKEAVEKHHEKYGVKCEWIIEIKTVA
jgi:Protein of unknown function (DUF4242)